MRIFLLFIFLLDLLPAFAQVDSPILEGIYKGENLKITCTKHDPSDIDPVKCNISINNKYDTSYIVNNKTEKFELSLDHYHFKKGDTLQIYSSVIPRLEVRVENPEELDHLGCHMTCTAGFISPRGYLHWKTLDDTLVRSYIVEQYLWKKWVVVGEVNAKRMKGVTEDSLRVIIHFGEDLFRIHEKFGCYSKEIKVPGHGPEVTTIGCKPVTYQQFNYETIYQIYDKDGKMVSSGKDDKFYVSTLQPGVYYINYDGRRSMEFIVKKRKQKRKHS